MYFKQVQDTSSLSKTVQSFIGHEPEVREHLLEAQRVRKVIFAQHCDTRDDMRP